MAEEKPQEAVVVSDDELKAALAGTAHYANKIYLTLNSAGVRLTFMEQLGDKVSPQYRAAVQLSIPDAFALRDLLVRQLKNVEVVEISNPGEAENG